MNFQSERVRNIFPPVSLGISLRAREMRRDGLDVLDFSLGEPDFDTPEHIIDAAHQAARQGQTRYTSADGTPELKSAIAAKFLNDNGLHFEHEH